MTRSAYFQACMNQPLEWLVRCADAPSPGRHIDLVRLAIRKKAAKVGYVDTCIEHAYGSTTRLSFQIRVF